MEHPMGSAPTQSPAWMASAGCMPYCHVGNKFRASTTSKGPGKPGSVAGAGC